MCIRDRLVIALIVWGTKNKRSSQSTGGVNAYSNPGFQSNAGLNEGAVIAKIKETDPDFSADLFKTYVKDVYLNVQEAWEKKRWDMRCV